MVGSNGLRGTGVILVVCATAGSVLVSVVSGKAASLSVVEGES